MKKKLLKGAIAFVALFAFMIFVYGYDSKLEIPFTLSVYPKDRTINIPAEGTELYSTLADKFDFSRVVFSEGSEETYGSTYMRKILLFTTPDFTKTGVDALGNNWFAAYCLDSDLKYPDYGIMTSSHYLGTDSTTDGKITRFNEIVLAALFNTGGSNIKNLLKNGPLDEEIIVNYTDDITEAVMTNIVDSIDSGDLTTQYTVGFTSIQFGDPAQYTISVYSDVPEGMNNALQGANGVYTLTFTGADVYFLKYKAETPSGKDYTKALWIIEHSYPTLPIRESLEKAGADYDTLSSQIAALQATDSPDDQAGTPPISNLSGSTLDAYVENYVYSTVQYAIWYVQNKDDADGDTIFNSIKNVSELDKLYKYLINNATDSSSYSGSEHYTNEVTITKPEKGKEIYQEKTDYYIYGPYGASYNALSNDAISLTITNTDKTGISLVDKDGNVINSVANGGEFYIKVDKKAKIASVTGTASVEHVTTFSPVTDRARVYTSFFPLAQNVMSGGKVNEISISKPWQADYNAKTGVENIALLLMVTLVAFSLGYMVLSFKAKPIGLN